MEAILTVLYIAIIICAALLTGFGVYSLYQMGQTAKEAKKTLRQANDEMVKIDGAVTAATEAVKSVSHTVQTAADALNKPMDGMIRGIRMAQSLIQKFREMSQCPTHQADPDADDSSEEDEVIATKDKESNTN